MKNSVTIAGITVASGEKYNGFVTVPGTDYQFPITIINGKEDGKKFIATAGIHGWEYPGIEAVVRLAQEMDPAEVKGLVVLVQCINVSAFYERQTYVVPADEKRGNLNYSFPGNREGTLVEKICACVSEDLVKGMDFHVDLHSGDANENLEAFVFACSPKDSENCLLAADVAKYLSFKYSGKSGGRRECYNSSSWDVNVPSMLFERGGNGYWSEEEVVANIEDLKTIMKYFKIIEGEIKVNEEQVFFAKHEWTGCQTKGMLYRFVEVGDDIKEGQKLFEIKDMFGNLIETIYAKYDGHVVIVQNTLSCDKGHDLITYGSPVL